MTGDSSGGNLAAVVAHMARDRNGLDISYQALLCISVSHHREWESIDQNGEGYFITKQDLAWFDKHYLEDDIDAMNVYASHCWPPISVACRPGRS